MLKNLESLKQKYGGIKIVILGFAREGVDTLRFLRKLFPQQIFGIADQKKLSSFEAEIKKLVAKDQNLKLHFGKDYLKALKNYDVVIKSPGISPKTIRPFLTKGQKISSQTEIFFNNCPGKIIGVTGTKGKSTTTSLTYRVLKSGGLKAFLIGNIGQPVLSLLFKAKPEDVYVYELSSHQLADLKKSPQIAVFLNLYPEHLDYYRSFNEYFKAKQNICRYQQKTDFFLFNPKNKYVSRTARISKARKIALNSKTAEKFLAKCGKIRLMGGFNLLNMAAAIEIGKIFKIPESKIIQTLKNFKPLPHRLEFVGQYQKIKFYNDSLATIPQATIEALAVLGDEVETIFLGGFDRGLEFKELAKKIIASNLKTLIFFPGTGERIWQEITKIKPK
ncbi:UDP-N-acetylmuramoyl-L-alanine--D-glutamate ligase, partial [Candidatus Parcubacteria bacterium]|nr:UDP-N-acetylmuramoyl-L-alanine--D-glutamate ligase [Patescibacteria group bacterium]MCG2688426.1 UDP-N-acetylmuramoyl-L-alanine--D-glutamate ligase [Candidatus Parcubacteria bacterium]